MYPTSQSSCKDKKGRRTMKATLSSLRKGRIKIEKERIYKATSLWDVKLPTCFHIYLNSNTSVKGPWIDKYIYFPTQSTTVVPKAYYSLGMPALKPNITLSLRLQRLPFTKVAHLPSSNSIINLRKVGIKRSELLPRVKWNSKTESLIWTWETKGGKYISFSSNRIDCKSLKKCSSIASTA